MNDLQLSPMQIQAVTAALTERKAELGFGSVPGDEFARGAVHVYDGLCTIVRADAAVASHNTAYGQAARERLARLWWFVMLIREISNGTFDQRPTSKLN
jgi:hypothetical protein